MGCRMNAFATIAVLMTLAAARLPGQDRRLEATVRSIPRPAGQKLRDPLPRPVLLLQARVREKEFEEGRWCTYLYDPASPKQGVRKIFEGKEGNYLRVLTPLFGGIGVAIATRQELGQESKSEMLCSASPSAEELRSFARSDPDLFYGPWR